MKLLALDIGDKWTGIAISDPLGMFARPYKTVESKQLLQFLQQTIPEESIKRVVVGYPKTMRGTESEQTKKVVAHAEALKQQLKDVEWVLWDERLTSQHAQKIKRPKSKEDKLQIHAVAAAYILSSYLNYLAMQKNME